MIKKINTVIDSNMIPSTLWYPINPEFFVSKQLTNWIAYKVHYSKQQHDSTYFLVPMNPELYLIKCINTMDSITKTT